MGYKLLIFESSQHSLSTFAHSTLYSSFTFYEKGGGVVDLTLMRKAVSMQPTPQPSGGFVELAQWDPSGACVELPMVRETGDAVARAGTGQEEDRRSEGVRGAEIEENKSFNEFLSTTFLICLNMSEKVKCKNENLCMRQVTKL